MSLILQGSTSGSVTLQEPAVAGTTVLDLPAVSGTILTTGSSGQSIPKAALPAGTVLQVVSTTLTSTVTVTSTSFSPVTGFTVTITPSNASSKILILTSMQGGNAGNNCTAVLTRNGSNICFADAASNRTQGTASAMNFGISTAANVVMNFLDSPATTSAVTYGVSVSSNTGSFFLNRSSRDNDAANVDGRFASTITVMEIAA